MIVVIRDGEALSLKMNFILKLISLKSDENFRISRIEAQMFNEKWARNNANLATSVSSVLAYFLLMIVKSPYELRDGVIRRLFNKRKKTVLLDRSFLSVISQTLYYYFATSARTNRVMEFLLRQESSKIFFVDEFLSINTVDLKKAKKLGIIVYVSQDIAYNRYGFRENLISKTLMYKLERKAIALADVVIACSERDRLKYIELGGKKTVFYPNIYPLAEFEPNDKDHVVSISIVLREHWGHRGDESLREIFEALSYFQMKIKIYMIGIAPLQVPRNVDIQIFEFIPNKSDYLQTLSKSWIGINLGIHLAGSNERKYDYAMAGLVVLSDNMGARGDLLPREYTYVDSQDLAAKLKQLIELGKEKITEMGLENREYSLYLADKQREKLVNTISSLMLSNS